MRMLTDLPDIGLAVGLRHPVFGFDLDLIIDLILEYFFEILYGHF